MKVKYVGIDFWNRPIFKEIGGIRLYCSLDILFPYRELESGVLEKLGEKDLVYYGIRTDYDPMGTKPTEKLEIVRDGKK